MRDKRRARRKSALHGRPRKLDADLDEYRIDALLVNWARWASGYAASVGYADGVEPHEGMQPNEDQARAMEIILVRMKEARPRLFKAVKFRYLFRFGDETAARAMSSRRQRETADGFRSLVLRAYAWIDGHLDGTFHA